MDDVNDVDANAWPNLVGVRPKFPAHVVGNDGGHDDAVCSANVSKNTAAIGIPLFDGVRILRDLAFSWCRHLCNWSGVGGA